MKKIATLMLGMSFVLGSVAFAQNSTDKKADSTSTTTKTKKHKKHKKAGSDDKMSDQKPQK